jgi:hypothetical protein
MVSNRTGSREGKLWMVAVTVCWSNGFTGVKGSVELVTVDKEARDDAEVVMERARDVDIAFRGAMHGVLVHCDTVPRIGVHIRREAMLCGERGKGGGAGAEVRVEVPGREKSSLGIGTVHDLEPARRLQHPHCTPLHPVDGHGVCQAISLALQRLFKMRAPDSQQHRPRQWRRDPAPFDLCSRPRRSADRSRSLNTRSAAASASAGPDRCKA